MTKLLTQSILALILFSYANNDYQKETSSTKVDSSQNTQDIKLPDSIHVIGTILEMTPGICGQLCFGGSLKVKLKNKISNYNSDYAYLITACLTSEVSAGTNVNVVASRLTDKDKECYYISHSNIHPKGFPLYKLSESETNKIH